jgi:capsular exopolysaccharide synthesis family protein
VSKTYLALKKAALERSQHGTRPAASSPRVREVRREHPAHIEYERIGVWLKNPTLGKRQVIMIVSCRSGTGSTTTTALLASTLAEARRSRVLIIDSNFRTPGLNLVFKIDGSLVDADASLPGLPLNSHIHKTDRQNLWVLLTENPSGAGPDALEGEAIDGLLVELRQRFDFVLFDAAPALDFPDAYLLAPKVDGVILVIDCDHTLISEAQRARLDLERAGARFLGVVLNRSHDYVPGFLRHFLGSSL